MSSSNHPRPADSVGREINKPPNYFELTPVRLREYAQEASGLVTVLIPRFEKRFWNKILPEKLTKRDIKINLDETGSAVWLQIDGKKNVQDICDILKEKFGETFIQHEDRIVKFISQLFSNKMITFKEVEK